MAKENKQTETIVEPYIGSYVLETLKTGMHAESRNALREYIQNSFDAIRAAVRGKVIKESEGRITVTLPDENTLTIRDNGTDSTTLVLRPTSWWTPWQCGFLNISADRSTNG